MKMRQISFDLLHDSGIPRRFWDLGRDTYLGDPECLERVEEYVKQFPRMYKESVGLWVTGPTQSYKTFLVTYAMKLLLVDGRAAKYFSLDKLFELYVSNETAGADFLRNFNGDLIVIDNISPLQADMGKDKGKRNALEKALTYLADNGYPYFISGPISSLDEISATYGQRIMELMDRDLIHLPCLPSATAAKAKKDRIRMELW